MKNYELFTLSQGIQSAGDLSGAKLAYALAKNLKVVTSEIEDLQTGIKPSDIMLAYEAARIELCKLHADKDEDGEALVVDGSFVITDKAAYDAEWKVLQGTYEVAISASEKAKADYKDLLDEDCNVELVMVSLDNFPDTVTAAQMSQLMSMVE